MKTKATKRKTQQRRKAQLTSKALSMLGRIGARARMEKLTAEERRAIAIKASRAAAAARRKKAAGKEDK